MNDGVRTQAPRMCNIETIDAELRLLWRAWRVAREMGCAPNTAFIDALLDERASRLAIPDRGCRSATKASGNDGHNGALWPHKIKTSTECRLGGEPSKA